MQPTTDQSDQSGQFQFNQQLASFAKSGVFNHYLVVNEKGELGETHVFKIIWEALKGAFGGRDWSDSRLIEYKVIQFLSDGKKYLNPDNLGPDNLALVEKLAAKTGLKNSTVRQHSELNGLIQSIKTGAFVQEPKEVSEKRIVNFYKHFETSFEKYPADAMQMTQIFQQAIPASSSDKIAQEAADSALHDEGTDVPSTAGSPSVEVPTLAEVMQNKQVKQVKQPQGTSRRAGYFALGTFALMSALAGAYAYFTPRQQAGTEAPQGNVHQGGLDVQEGNIGTLDSVKDIFPYLGPYRSDLTDPSQIYPLRQHDIGYIGIHSVNVSQISGTSLAEADNETASGVESVAMQRFTQNPVIHIRGTDFNREGEFDIAQSLSETASAAGAKAFSAVAVTGGKLYEAAAKVDEVAGNSFFTLTRFGGMIVSGEVGSNISKILDLPLRIISSVTEFPMKCIKIALLLYLVPKFIADKKERDEEAVLVTEARNDIIQKKNEAISKEIEKKALMLRESIAELPDSSKRMTVIFEDGSSKEVAAEALLKGLIGYETKLAAELIEAEGNLKLCRYDLQVVKDADKEAQALRESSEESAREALKSKKITPRMESFAFTPIKGAIMVEETISSAATFFRTDYLERKIREHQSRIERIQQEQKQISRLGKQPLIRLEALLKMKQEKDLKKAIINMAEKIEAQKEFVRDSASSSAFPEPKVLQEESKQSKGPHPLVKQAELEINGELERVHHLSDWGKQKKKRIT